MRQQVLVGFTAVALALGAAACGGDDGASVRNLDGEGESVSGSHACPSGSESGSASGSGSVSGSASGSASCPSGSHAGSGSGSGSASGTEAADG